jgi:hypothetical protein
MKWANLCEHPHPQEPARPRLRLAEKDFVNALTGARPVSREEAAKIFNHIVQWAYDDYMIRLAADEAVACDGRSDHAAAEPEGYEAKTAGEAAHNQIVTCRNR